jgi:hypothetical protein
MSEPSIYGNEHAGMAWNSTPLPEYVQRDLERKRLMALQKTPIFPKPFRGLHVQNTSCALSHKALATKLLGLVHSKRTNPQG